MAQKADQHSESYSMFARQAESSEELPCSGPCQQHIYGTKDLSALGIIQRIMPEGRQYLLQSFLAACLALAQVVLAVVLVAVALQVHVALGAPLAVVHAIHNAPELPTAVPQGLIKPPPTFLGLALPCVPVPKQDTTPQQSV